MRYTFSVLLLFVFAGKLLAQKNLIPNPSFEDTVLRTTPLFLPDHWGAPTNEGWNYYTPLHIDTYPNWGAPDNIFGNQAARTGDSYIGIRVYKLDSKIRSTVREYAQVKLDSQLTADSAYCLQLFISMADSMVFASKNQLGVYFSTNAVSGNDRGRLPYSPQIIISPDSFNTDKENWVEYNFEYQAQGGEQYLTVGNFNDTNSLDTAFVSGGGNKFWMKASYYYFDDFWLGHCDSVPFDTGVGLSESILQHKIKVYPNPTTEQLFIQYNGNAKLQVQLYNLLGQSVHFDFAQCDNCPKQNSKQLQLSVGHLQKGVYVLEIIAGEKRISRKIIKE